MRHEREAWNLRLVAHHHLDGHGDVMHVNVQDGFAYVGHMGSDRVGTSILDVSTPGRPALVTQLYTPPGTHSHKVQVSGEILLVNYERNPREPHCRTWAAGLAVFDISHPWHPRQIGFLSVAGKGVHRMTFWNMPYVTMSASAEGFTDQFFLIVDLSDPTDPKPVGHWWLPGMNVRAGETSSWPKERTYKHHHSLVRGDRAYGGWWDAGLVILDISDVAKPTLVSRLDFGADVSGATHTALPVPGRDVLVVTDECTQEGPGFPETEKKIRVLDISDETYPKVIGEFPQPPPIYHMLPGRSGPHNLHEMRPGSYQSSRTIHATYFNAGVRVFDITDAAAPVEIARYVPKSRPNGPFPQLNDLTVTDTGVIYATDRAGGGLYILEPEVDFA